MSDRVVRELPRALVDRLDGVERRLRALSLRAWPGTVRTEIGDSFVPPTDVYNDWTTVLTLTVPSGRWIVSGEFEARIIPSGIEAFDFQAKVTATDAETGDDVTVNCDTPARAWTGTTDATTQIPLTVTSDIRSSLGDITLLLQTASLNSTPYDLSRLRLKAVPV